MKKQLNKSTINGERHENKELQDKADKVETSGEAEEILREFEFIIISKNINIKWLAYQQGKVFECLISV